MPDRRHICIKASFFYEVAEKGEMENYISVERGCFLPFGGKVARLRRQVFFEQGFSDGRGRQCCALELCSWVPQCNGG